MIEVGDQVTRRGSGPTRFEVLAITEPATGRVTGKSVPPIAECWELERGKNGIVYRTRRRAFYPEELVACRRRVDVVEMKGEEEAR